MPNPADWLGGERNRRKLTRKVILDYDHCRHTSYHRELEMSVDAITCDAGDQRYTMQFFYDLQVYGVGHAVASLENFVHQKAGNRYQKAIDKLRDQITSMYNVMIVS